MGKETWVESLPRPKQTFHPSNLMNPTPCPPPGRRRVQRSSSMWKLKTSTLGISTNNPLFCLPPGRLKNTPARRVCFLKHPRGSAELSASPPHSDLPSECSLRPVVLPSLCRRAGQARSGFLGCNYGAGTAGISGVRHVDRQCWDRGQTLGHHHQVSCCALQTHTHTHTHTHADTHT